MKYALETLKSHPLLVVFAMSFGVLAYAMHLALGLLQKVQG